MDFSVQVIATKRQPFIIKEALGLARGHLVHDRFNLIQPYGSLTLKMQSCSEVLGLKFETLGGESFGLVLGRFYGRVRSSVVFNLNDQRFDEMAISAFSNILLSAYRAQKREYCRDRISFVVPSSQSINVSIKRLPPVKPKQDAHSRVEIFGRPTKSYLQLGIF